MLTVKHTSRELASHQTSPAWVNTGVHLDPQHMELNVKDATCGQQMPGICLRSALII